MVNVFFSLPFLEKENVKKENCVDETELVLSSNSYMVFLSI